MMLIAYGFILNMVETPGAPLRYTVHPDLTG